MGRKDCPSALSQSAELEGGPKRRGLSTSPLKSCDTPMMGVLGDDELGVDMGDCEGVKKSLVAIDGVDMDGRQDRLREKGENGSPLG